MRNARTAPSDWRDWTDPRYFDEAPKKENRFLAIFLRQLLPEREHRTRLTLPGWMLVLVSLGIGSAAYNTSSNILFLTLSVLLSSLILSGVLSALNFRGLVWELQVPKRLRAGEVGMAEIELHNNKTIFPCLSVWFELKCEGKPGVNRLYLRHALPPGGRTRLESTFRPERRGECPVSISGVFSQFPFGFLRKRVGSLQEKRVCVWPARALYRFDPTGSGRRHQGEVAGRSRGQGADLLNVRQYERGDPPRLVHWKASARMGRLMVRQLAEEHTKAYLLRIETDATRWAGPRFERLCSLACSLAEDLFHQGRLERIEIDDHLPILVRDVHDLHYFFDLMAKAEPANGARAPARPGSGNAISFRPSGESGITIHMDEHVAGEIDG